MSLTPPIEVYPATNVRKNFVTTKRSFCGHSKQSNLKTVKRLKKIGITILERDIFRSPWHQPRQEGKNNLFKLKFKLHDKKLSMGPNDLFDLNDFSNYGSSNYRSFLVRFY